jgi:hypothetical protein
MSAPLSRRSVLTSAPPLKRPVDIDAQGGVRAWSRHGTNLAARLGALLGCFVDLPPGTIIDGELLGVPSQAQAIDRGERGVGRTDAPHRSFRSQDLSAIVRGIER